MKKLILLAIVLMPFASCMTKSMKEAQKRQTDSLQVIISNKDALVNEVYSSLRDITSNLNAIKSRENIISSAVSSGEVKRSAIEQVKEDVKAIDALLKSNNEKMAKLQRAANQLRAANAKVASLEQLVAEMKDQIENKDREIAELKAELERMNIRVQELTTQVESLETANCGLKSDLAAQTDKLNTVFFVVGKHKELLKKGLVEKAGKIIRLAPDTDGMTQADARTLEEIPVGGKKAVLVSSHPSGSYQMVMNGKVCEKIVILDKAEFWSNTKLMVISHK